MNCEWEEEVIHSIELWMGGGGLSLRGGCHSLYLIMGGRRRSFTQRRRSMIPEDFSDSPSPTNFGFDFWDL